MVTETYATVDEFRDKTGYTDDDTSDADLQALLEEGHREMEAAVGQSFEDTFVLNKLKPDEDTLDNVLDLTFAPVFEVVEVVQDDDRIIVAEQDYTVDKEAGEITLDASFVDDNLHRGSNIRVRYIPAIYRDLEIWMAVYENKTVERIKFPETEEAQVYDNAANKAQSLVNRINRRVPTGTARDGAVRRGTK